MAQWSGQFPLQPSTEGLGNRCHKKKQYVEEKPTNFMILLTMHEVGVVVREYQLWVALKGIGLLVPALTVSERSLHAPRIETGKC